jgi:hypothetical protein
MNLNVRWKLAVSRFQQLANITRPLGQHFCSDLAGLVQGRVQCQEELGSMRDKVHAYHVDCGDAVLSDT